MRPFLFANNLFPDHPEAVRPGKPERALTMVGNFLFWPLVGREGYVMGSTAGAKATELSDYAILFEGLREKLDPNRFPDMNPRFAKIVRAILGPRREALCMDGAGSIFDDERGFLATRQWLIEHWEDFITSANAGLTSEEYQEAQGFLRCILHYWRSEAPDKKPYMEKFAQAISMAYKVTDNPKEIATLVVEIMSPKERNAEKN